MWYILIAVFVLVGLFIGFRMALSMDKHLDKTDQADD